MTKRQKSLFTYIAVGWAMLIIGQLIGVWDLVVVGIVLITAGIVKN